MISNIGGSSSTTWLIDEAGQPTIEARDEILSFLARRLSKSLLA